MGGARPRLRCAHCRHPGPAAAIGLLSTAVGSLGAANDPYSSIARMMLLGQDLLTGESLSRDVAAGVGWLRRAAEAGNWWAIARLARLYDQGAPGVPADRDEAAVWKRRLADLGDREAAGWLALHGYR